MTEQNEQFRLSQESLAQTAERLIAPTPVWYKLYV